MKEELNAQVLWGKKSKFFLPHLNGYKDLKE